jgi:hypothetical protein
MARQGQRNYYRMRLNSETASYVYKLIAMKEIIENPIQYGFVSRKTQLLAQKQEYKPAQTNITPKVEQDALRAFAVLQN